MNSLEQSSNGRGSDHPAPHRLRVLTFSTLFPSAARPQHGVFVEERLRHLLASDDVTAEVLAPVPWFPSEHERFGGYAAFARTPRHEVRNDIAVHHPRYALVPKIGMTAAPLALALGALAQARTLHQQEPIHLIDAHYFYPDGVAATLLGRWLGLPVVITARGTDINLISRYRMPRAMIRWAAREVNGLVAVCQSLKDEMEDLGVAAGKIRVIRNGVDLEKFSTPEDRTILRDRLGFEGHTLLAVGRLVELKGHRLILEGLAALPASFRLVIIGDGPEHASLQAYAEQLGLVGRVKFLGALSHDALPDYYGAADALVLASSSEGMPNVVLEALACGCPVIAPPVGGIPELVTAPVAGVLTTNRSADAITQAAQALFADYPPREAVRRYAEGFSWEATTAGQLELFRAVRAEHARHGGASAPVR